MIPLSPFLISELEGWGVREGFIVPTNGNGDRARQAVAEYMTHRWRKTGVRAEARGRYIDPWQALHLEDAVKQVPLIGGSNVVPLATVR